MSTQPNHNFADLTGKQFAHLKVLSRAENTMAGKSQWLCRCECGKSVQVRADHLRGAKIKSCGCKVALLVSKAVRRPMNTLGIYNGMKERVICESTPSNAHYRKHGIRICRGWIGSFKNFLADMGERPAGMTIDRIDSKGNYSCGHCEECKANGWPANCRWSTAKEQARNRSSNVLIEFQGERRCISEWAEVLGVPHYIIRGRLRLGWHPTEALSAPVRVSKKHSVTPAAASGP